MRTRCSLDVCEKPSGEIDILNLKKQPPLNVCQRIANTTVRSKTMVQTNKEINKRRQPGAQAISFSPFISTIMCFPSPRTCLKTKSFFFGLVTRCSFQYFFVEAISSFPPGRFSQQFDGAFLGICGKVNWSTGSSVWYLCKVLESNLKCAFKCFSLTPSKCCMPLSITFRSRDLHCKANASVAYLCRFMNWTKFSKQCIAIIGFVQSPMVCVRQRNQHMFVPKITVLYRDCHCAKVLGDVQLHLANAWSDLRHNSVLFCNFL